MADSSQSDALAPFIDDAVHEINQRWGEPFGDDMLPMDQALVRETAEAIVLPHYQERETLRSLLREAWEDVPVADWYRRVQVVLDG
jgi:dephospho-CoA kinase